MTTRAAVDVETGIWRAGSGAPSNSLGGAGDFYVDTVTGAAYYKASTTYAGLPLAGLGKNLLINGDMRIDQRNAFASVTPTTATYLLDRWLASVVGTGRLFWSKSSSGSVSAPPGRYLQAVVSTPVTVGATDQNAVQQVVEGLNVAQLRWGSSQAKSLTLSFWAGGSITGTYPVSIFNGAANRFYLATYTLNVASTWEYKTITIPGDTTGTWAVDNTAGLVVYFGLGDGTNFNGTAGAWTAGTVKTRTSGCVNFTGTNGASWFISDVQLEEGIIATPYERRTYALELALCQRYYEKSFDQGTAPAQNTGVLGGAHYSEPTIGGSTANNYMTMHPRFKVTKRTQPTIGLYNPSAANAFMRNYVRNNDASVTTASNNDTGGFILSVTGNGNWVLGDLCGIHWHADAEL